MPSKMRHGLLISLIVISLIAVSFNTSYADTTNYVYDELNRLIRVEYGDGTKIVYTYDEAGNRSQVCVGEYTLAANVVGSGTVTKNPDQPFYSAGTNVALTAVNGSQTFSEWSGDLTGNTNPTTILMNGNKSVTATFVTPEGWLQGWTYRKPVTLSRASGAVTNYQMKLLVGESSGASGENVDCNGHVQPDFDDLRFTTADGITLLDYWIESITGTIPNQLATVWIEFDSIGTGATTFYMYYGKSDAPAYSNGGNTFISFQNFENDIVGQIPSGWTEEENPAKGTFLTISGGQSGKGAEAVCTSIAYAAAGPTISPGTQCCIEARVKFIGNGEFRLSTYRAGFRREGAASTFKYLTNDSPYWINSGISEDASWHKLKIMIYDTNKVDYWLDGSSFVNKNIYGGNQNWTYYGIRFQETGTVDIDEIFVRNYRATEPTWGSWGAEEAN